MYYLICTSYTETKDGLVLRNNWVELADNNKLLHLIELWKLPDDFPYPQNGSISNIMHGRMADLDNVVIHVRIIRY